MRWLQEKIVGVIFCKGVVGIDIKKDTEGMELKGTSRIEGIEVLTDLSPLP